MTTPISCVLYLEPLSQSLRYRFYRDQVGSQVMLQWWVERVLSMAAVGRLYIVCHDSSESVLVSELLQGSRASVFVSHYYIERRALAALAREAPVSHLAVLPVGFALAPADLLARVYAQHQAAQNTVTVVHGLPEGTWPAIFDKELLISVDECDVPGLPPRTAAAVERLAHLLKVTGEDLSLPVRGEPFNAQTAYDIETARLPRRVVIETRSDMEILRRTVDRMEAGEGRRDLRALEVWKEEKTNQATALAEEYESTRPTESRAGLARTKKRVLYVSTPSAFSGAEQSLCQLVSQVDWGRFEKMAIIGLDGVFGDALRRAGAAVMVRETDFGRPTVANLLYAVSTLRRLQPDVVHLNAPDALPIMGAARLLGVPAVLHVRNGIIERYEDIAGSADAVIVISEFLRREILAFDIPAAKVHLMYNEVDLDYFKRGTFQRGQVRQELGVPAGARVVLMIARFAQNKRHDLMLRAAVSVRKAVPDVHLVLKGETFAQSEGELYASLQGEAKRLGLWDNITWLRFVPDIRALHEMADILVLCSDREGLGRCIVEAMAMELPVVVTDSGGSHELVGNMERGLKVRGGDATDLAAKMIMALTEEGLMREMAARARKFAESELSARLAAQRMMEIYDDLLSLV